MGRFSVVVALVFAAVLSAPLNAQSIPSLDTIKTDAELTRAITALDKQLFDGFNTCDLDKMKALVSEDLEFYHDKTGLAVGRQVFLDAVRNNICGKVQRELVAGSLEIYPIKDYGAVEIGVHRFTHPWKQDHGEVGEAKFIHLWQYRDGAWKVTRVISFDHHGAK
ncbi:nuclear transport factor 2 family protein [Edaphobacter albus]|uniref:nuclear transport factor 2 family protein n=1 Tax=Edaphobacter sp. 4G125 TaxID=2763071 RepID=UPI0016471BE9|nr:nuclear transport factor 2 family protein [Edaphobacter sp. 4G125]QNI37712.1 nuclear transport factor 2 family protein [Edaphobacter sp. 4G125]